MIRVALPALTTLIAVASLVGLAGWNKSSEAQGPLTLTEREMPLGTQLVSIDDGDGLQLPIVFQWRANPLDTLNWLPESKLRALGFPLNVPPGDPNALQIYADLPPRLAWIVLEYDGPAWKEIERRRQVQRQDLRDRNADSRLVPVDAGLDATALRNQYSKGHLIVRGVIAINFLGPSSGGPLLYGSLRELVPSMVTVPRQYVPTLVGLAPVSVPPSLPDAPRPELVPRYEVEVGVGRIGIPFIKGIRRLDEGR
jgi:hypothetical protein